MAGNKSRSAHPHAATQVPVASSTMPGMRLRPGMAAHAATRLILRQLLEILRANEAGIKADADIEFLHEYRVAVRRTRSILSQIKNVFPPAKVEFFKREFRTLGRRTNDLRNLDVFLSTEMSYRGRLPEGMREDITPLFDYLRSRRSGAFAVVVSHLESKSYDHMLDEWERFLGQPIVGDSPPNARMPVLKLARGRIERQYRIILRDGVLALDQPGDEALHNLRIECKKLRYLLEFFADLFPPEEMAPLLKPLKRLQDNLGAMSDLGDQRTYLYSISQVMDYDEPQARKALMATGYLLEAIAREQQSIRAEFTHIFKGFASPAHRKQIRKLIR